MTLKPSLCAFVYFYVATPHFSQNLSMKLVILFSFVFVLQLHFPILTFILRSKQYTFTVSRKSRLQEIRQWIKNLPTYGMTLMDGAWQVLDAPVIKEIDRITKSFYTVSFAFVD